MLKQKSKFSRTAFTLVELLMALTISGIILAAVASLAFAMSSAYDAGDETAEIQSRLRITTLRISELIKNSKLILGNRGDRVSLWRGDFNGNNMINPNEIVYIESGDRRSYIRLIEFDPDGLHTNFSVSVSDIQNGNFHSAFAGADLIKETTFIPVCSNVLFTTDVNPPHTKRLTISFDLTENGMTRSYQINSALRCWAGNLIDSSGIVITQDDD